ncbi:tetraspanin-32 isoform X6 [Bos taurus]|uniref:tetraspanin-32 isoform X6 n=1 Tax=Bos taurus TaxID=9913 RepID=UPI0028CB5D38|nr:tetraspanin-32 isoform X6 [Bos taurus]
MLTGRWVTNLTQLLVGNCGLRSPPSWKPKPQREGRGGEERVGRGVESRGEQTDLHGALQSSQGGQMPDAGHQPLCSGCWRRLVGVGAQPRAYQLYVPACSSWAPPWPPQPRSATLGPTSLSSAPCPQTGPPMRPCTTGAFLSFALVFCALVQAAFWRAHSPTQMEDAVLDAYDRAYERALRSASGSGRQELVAIQDTFLCCGKSSPLGLLGGLEADLCQGEEAARQDCLRGIQSFLRVHGNIVSTLIGLGLAFTVYAMLLSSFIWFTIRLGRYPVSQRARDHPPQEPRVYRCIREGSPSPRPSKADAPGGRLSPSRRSGQLLLLQDTHPPTHGSGEATVSTRM